jgi:thiamine pyrophosphate-dependent acetolactate synthase large subunit-like protein
MPVPGMQDPHTPWFMVPTRYDQVFAAMGAYTERVEDPDKLRPALERAFASGRTAVIDAVVDRTTEPTRGTPRGTWAQQAKGFLAYLDPEDVPDELRAEMYPDEKE